MLREALAKEIDLAEGDIYQFGGLHCDEVVASVLSRLGCDADPAEFWTASRGPAPE